jgi:hypothetical protein
MMSLFSENVSKTFNITFFASLLMSVRVLIAISNVKPFLWIYFQKVAPQHHTNKGLPARKWGEKFFFLKRHFWDIFKFH